MARFEANGRHRGVHTRAAESPVEYDVERGLARHRQLVASGAPLPAWETTPPRSTPMRRGGAWWGLAALLLVGATLWGYSASETAPGKSHTAQSRRAETPFRAATGTSAGAPTAHDSTPSESLPSPRDARPGHAPGRPKKRVDDARQGATPPVPRPPVVAAELAASSDSASETTDTPPERAARTTPAEPRRATSSSPTRAKNPGAAGHGDVRGVAPADGQEIRQLARARAMLPVDPLRTLRLVREGHQRFRRGYLRQERRYLEVRALFSLGRTHEAVAHALWFEQDYPDGPYTAEIRAAAARHRDQEGN